MKRIVLLILCGVALLTAAPALADSSPTRGTYQGTGANQISKVQGATASQSSPSSAQGTLSSNANSLPFTGLNVGVLAVIAVGLVASGLLIRRRLDTDRS